MQFKENKCIAEENLNVKKLILSANKTSAVYLFYTVKFTAHSLTYIVFIILESLVDDYFLYLDHCTFLLSHSSCTLPPSTFCPSPFPPLWFTMSLSHPEKVFSPAHHNCPERWVGKGEEWAGRADIFNTPVDMNAK